MTQWQWLVFLLVLLGFILIFGIMYALYRDEDLSRLKRLTRNAKPVWRTAKQVVVFVVGLTVILAGIALLVLPGPGLLLIIVGLAVLATEFFWARKLLRRARVYAKASARKGKKRFFLWRRPEEPAAPGEPEG